MLKIIRTILLFWMFGIPYEIWASNSIIYNINERIELRNNHVSIVFSQNADLISFTDLKTNQNLGADNKKKVAYAKFSNGTVIEASRLALKGDRLCVEIGKHNVELELKAYDDFFTVEVKNKYLPDIEELTFINLNLANHSVSSTSFCAIGVAMSLQTNPIHYPSFENKEIIGRCTSHTGLYGAKLAIVACENTRLWEIIKSVYYSCPKNSVPVVFSSGGPFAFESEANRYDCVHVGGTDVSPSKVSEWVDFCYEYGIKQIEFVLGPFTFTQGDFNFPKLGNASSFKKQITDKLYDEGIISSLHTYSYYINYAANDILSDQKWQSQLEVRAEYILPNSILSSDVSIPVIGDVAIIKNPGSAFSVYSPFILIDNELIRYEVGWNGFINCKRGQCGTKATSHKGGSKVRVIGGYYTYIAPQIGSELFYEIARRTAKAYNEGGFRGFYFDALDGLDVHLKNIGLGGYYWYYGAAFINEVLKYCVNEPLILECSHLFPTIWSARGRGECWDVPYRGYKNFIDDHLYRNKYLMSRNYVGTLGWYDFYPTKADEPRNFSTKYLFTDDVDYLGVKSIIYDQTMVYNGLLYKRIESIPALSRNVDLYKQYSILRNERFFSEKVKESVRKGPYEYHLYKKNGVWGFFETAYCRSKIRNITTDRLIGNNPFRTQKPFLRLENNYSSDCSSYINLMCFDEETDLKYQKQDTVFVSGLDLSEHMAIRVSLKGNGPESEDAICIRLRSPELSGYADYMVRLNFDGWRDIIVPNLDNAEYSDIYFKGMPDDYYRMHRYNVDYKRVNSVNVFLSGQCNKAFLKRIDAVPIKDNPLTNATITIGKASVMFVDTIQSGEYIEYKVGDKTASVYDNMGKCRNIEVKRKGKFIVPNGFFSASVVGSSQLTDAPSEVTLTLGLYGEFIHN